MPRSLLIRLLAVGSVPHHTVGLRRRVHLQHRLVDQAHRNAERHAAIERIAQAAFDAGMYDAVLLPDGAHDE